MSWSYAAGGNGAERFAAILFPEKSRWFTVFGKCTQSPAALLTLDRKYPAIYVF